jgi:hypothetical protein
MYWNLFQGCQLKASRVAQPSVCISNQLAPLPWFSLASSMYNGPALGPTTLRICCPCPRCSQEHSVRFLSASCLHSIAMVNNALGSVHLIHKLPSNVQQQLHIIQRFRAGSPSMHCTEIIVPRHDGRSQASLTPVTLHRVDSADLGVKMTMMGFTTHLSPTRHLADVTPTTVQTGSGGTVV